MEAVTRDYVLPNRNPDLPARTVTLTYTRKKKRNGITDEEVRRVFARISNGEKIADAINAEKICYNSFVARLFNFTADLL